MKSFSYAVRFSFYLSNFHFHPRFQSYKSFLRKTIRVGSKNFESASPYTSAPFPFCLNQKTFSRMAGESEKKSVVIACVQLCCTEDKEKNFHEVRSLITAAKEKNAKMIFMPEAFDYIGRSKEESAQLSETLDGPLMTSYKSLAKELGVWLSLGGFHERQTEMRDESLPWMTNNHVLIDADGEIQSVYRKVHLFDVVIPEENVFLTESSFTKAGDEILEPVETPIGRLGLGICYDLRFPRFSSTLRAMGADVLTYPSAFTVPTGKAHWETLLRARAIETQCFVIAAAQTGQHNSKRSSYGHSLIVDPWGKVLADGGENVGIITAEIELDQINSIRKKMPVVEHSRHDLYNDDAQGRGYRIPPDHIGDDSFQFGHVSVKYKFAFLESAHARAFVNRKCVRPGHVLVSCKSVKKRMQDLSSKEIGDMFCLVQKVQQIMESIHGANSSTVTVQDGKDSGQTIEHVHIHVIPRTPSDFKGDEIYDKLAEHDKGENIQWRDDSEMLEECNLIREHVKNKFPHFLN